MLVIIPVRSIVRVLIALEREMRVTFYINFHDDDVDDVDDDDDDDDNDDDCKIFVCFLGLFICLLLELCKMHKLGELL